MAFLAIEAVKALNEYPKKHRDRILAECPAHPSGHDVHKAARALSAKPSKRRRK